MSIDYYVVELNDDFSGDESITAKIAEAFSLDPRKANLLLSKSPGAVTKPIIRAEAELVAARFRRAGLKAVLKKIDYDENPNFIRTKTSQTNKLAENINLPTRNLLTSTMIQEPAKLSKNKAQYKLRILASSLVATLSLVALALFFFLISSNGPDVSSNVNWQKYGLLIFAAIFSLAVSLPILIQSYNNFKDLN